MKHQKLHVINFSKSPNFDVKQLLEQKGGWTPSEWARSSLFECKETRELKNISRL